MTKRKNANFYDVIRSAEKEKSDALTLEESLYEEDKEQEEEV